MELNSIFNRLWTDYATLNPSAAKILDLFRSEGETVVNDHIAFRTIDDPRINIEVIARPFIRHGYQQRGEYVFRDKHLYARHFELPGMEDAPRIFISQLKLQDVSEFTRNTFLQMLDRVHPEISAHEDLIFMGNIFEPLSYKVYRKLLEESEYAAWFYVFGFRANHFTVSVNSLKLYNSLEKVNLLLKERGFTLNTSGGEIKGTRNDHLRQSSTMADIVGIKFEEGVFNIPCCYYEFAERYPLSDGTMFSGFVAGSADKIFESTDNYLVKNKLKICQPGGQV